jgi:radical SAM protein with 4Fe4S-binding SPASM domain
MPIFLGSIRRKINAEILQFAYNRQWTRAVGKPVVFQIELTNHCPMTCQMCPRTHAMERPLGYMPLETFQRIVDQASGSTRGVFLHHFGDSLLHPQLGDCVGYAAAEGIRTRLSANPGLLTKSRIKAIVDGGLSELVLSLDGVTPDTSEAVRGRAARNVDLAERRIGQLIDYRRTVGSSKPFIVLQIVRQRQNAHEVEAWLSKWRGYPGVDRLKVKGYVSWDGREEKINSLRIEPKATDPSLVCDKPWTSVTILWDGRVVPCCFDYDGIMTLGSLADQSLEEIWQGEKRMALRQTHRTRDLSAVTLCAKCNDKEGYPVRKVYYPLNRMLQSQSAIGAELDLD